MKTFKVLVFYKAILKYHLSTTIHISCISGGEFIQTLLVQSAIIHFLMWHQKTVSLCLCLSLSLSLSLSVSLSVSISVSISVSLCLCLSVSLSLFLSRYIYLSRCTVLKIPLYCVKRMLVWCKQIYFWVLFGDVILPTHNAAIIKK